MILLSAVIVGLMVGWFRAMVSGRQLAPAQPRYGWLALAAFVLQGIAFSFHPIRQWIPDSAAALLLIISQAVAVIFFAANGKNPGFAFAALGVGLNLLVIVVNGGFMPISPETVTSLNPDAPAGSWQIGERLGWGKDVILPVSSTRFWFLSDHLMLPTWFPYRVAFSWGDLLMATGVMWSL
jgi:hypothetical protein